MRYIISKNTIRFKTLASSIDPLAQIGCLSGQSTEDLNEDLDENRQYLIEDSTVTGCNKKNKKRAKIVSRSKSPIYQLELDIADEDSWKHTGKVNQPMFSLQNCTLQSEDRGDGETYWVSFEEKSFSKGNEFKVYNGRMNGAGPKSGDRCVVKVFRQCQGTKSLCACEVKKSLKAKEIAKAFRNVCPNQESRIKIATVYWALMDEVSKLKLLFFTGERKLSTREAVLFEDDVRISDEKPGKPRKLSLYINASGESDHSISRDLEAFVHFSYDLSNGKLVICGLEGVQDEDGYFLKTPTIHSEAKEFGNKDQGMNGIQEIFRRHKCNDLCKNMLKPDMEQVIIDSGSPAKCPASSSFPFPTEPKLNLNDDCCLPCKLNHPNHSVINRHESSKSEITEGMSDYLEPSAPVLEDLDEDVFIPQPPPYSQHFVANWLINEQLPNCFVPPVQENILSVHNRSETSQGENLNQVTQDMNANFTDVESISGGVSNTSSVEDSSDRTCVQFDKKKVRFNLLNSPSSANASSTQFSSDSQRDTSTSGFSSQPQSIIKHSTANAFEPVTHFSPISPSFTTSEMSQHFFTDSPPSYYDSQVHTAYWIVQRGYLPVHPPAPSAPISDNNNSCAKTTVAAVITPKGQVANFFPVAVNNIPSTSM
nr:alpha-protein kinase vwkA-like [Biomphalaria glabrata]